MKGLLLVMALWLPGLATAGSLQPLAATDVAALLKPPSHGERIIALWALDCAYCEPNLQALATLQRAHPKDVELVTVTTDSFALRTSIDARLHKMKMDVYPARAYAETSPEHINFLIDQSWGGETPRVLVIRANGSRLAISGAL
ncbi:MAG TPA: hypothetical protein VN043_11005, partial [Rhodanobacter sp.]|nr:hypothetical protein [Rhodanobacter sp.]